MTIVVRFTGLNIEARNKIDKKVYAESDFAQSLYPALHFAVLI